MSICYDGPILTVDLSIVDNEDDTATLIVTFSEGVVGFDPTVDVIITPTPSDVGLTFVNTVTISTSVYHVNYTIDNGINGGVVNVYIPKNRVQSIADSLDNLESNTVGLTIVSEATAPTVVLGIQDHGDNTATLTVTFSEDVSGFDQTDVVITPTPSDVDLIFDEIFVISASVYEINYLIDDGANGGSINLQVLTGSAQSVATGLDNADSNLLVVAIADVDPPSVTLGVVDNGDNTATLTATFSEGVTGFTNTDVIIVSSDVSLVFNSMNVVSTAVYELTYDIFPTTVLGTSDIQVMAASAQSIATGLDNLDSNIVTLSTPLVSDIPPTVVISAVDNTDNTVTLTVTFSEGVTGFDENDVTINPSPGDVGLMFDSINPISTSLYELEYTMINGVGGGNVDIQVPSMSAQSLTNGLYNDPSNIENLVIGSIESPPTVIITAADNSDGTATLTVVFSRGVNGFDETDITITPTPGDVGLIFISLNQISTATYEVIYTITDGANGGSVDVYVPAASAQGVTDGVDNLISNVDTLPIGSTAGQPSVTIALVDNGGLTATLSVLFSEDVTGFDPTTEVNIVASTNLGLTYVSHFTIGLDYWEITYTIINTLPLGDFGTIDVYIPASVAQSVAASLNNTLSNTESLSFGEIDPALSFITQWRTTSSNESINLPIWALGSNITIDWGDGDVQTGYLIIPSHEYAVAGDYTVTISGGIIGTYGDITTPSEQLKCIDIIQFGDLGTVNWNNAFSGTSLTSVTATDGPTSDAQNLQDMFSSIPTLTDINTVNWDTSSVETMTRLFADNPSLTTVGDVSGWNVLNVFSMDSMFEGDTLLASLNISSWGVLNVITSASMFEGCSSLVSLGVASWSTLALSNISRMFNGCTLLTTVDISPWNVQNLSIASDLFVGVPLLTAQYDAILVAWSAQSLQAGVVISFDTTTYSIANQALRDILTDPPNLWFITDGGPI